MKIPVDTDEGARNSVSFPVVDRSEGYGVRGELANEWPGVVRPMFEWHLDDDVQELT